MPVEQLDREFLTADDRIRSMTRKWGSCSTLGIVTLAAGLADQQPGAPIRMLVSRTIHTRGSDLFVDQVEDFLLVLPSVAILELADGNIQDVAAHRFIDKS